MASQDKLPISMQVVEQADEEPVAYYVKFGRRVSDNMQVVFDSDEILYAAPFRTRDLSDDEIESIMVEQGDLRTIAFARAVIAAYKEKNK